MTPITLCLVSRLIALSLCDTNTTLDDNFPTIGPLKVVNEVGDDYEDTSTPAEDLSDELEMPPPLSVSETTSPSSVLTTTQSLDFDDSDNAEASSTLPVTTTVTSFPTPVNSLQIMMNKAQLEEIALGKYSDTAQCIINHDTVRVNVNTYKFADEYLTKKQQHELHVVVEETRRNGADRDEVRRAVLRYLNSVLTSQQKRQISARKTELNEEFSDEAFLRPN